MSRVRENPRTRAIPAPLPTHCSKVRVPLPRHPGAARLQKRLHPSREGPVRVPFRSHSGDTIAPQRCLGRNSISLCKSRGVGAKFSGSGDVMNIKASKTTTGCNLNHSRQYPHRNRCRFRHRTLQPHQDLRRHRHHRSPRRFQRIHPDRYQHRWLHCRSARKKS